MIEKIIEGRARTVVWVADVSKRFRGKEYFDGLPKDRRAKLQALFERMAEAGEIKNPEQFRLERDGIYCFKRFQDRMMCFFDGKSVCITNGFRKKSERTSPKEIERAMSIRKNYISEKG